MTGFNNADYVNTFDVINPSGGLVTPAYTQKINRPALGPPNAWNTHKIVNILGTDDKILVYHHAFINQLNLTTG